MKNAYSLAHIVLIPYSSEHYSYEIRMIFLKAKWTLAGFGSLINREIIY